MKETALLLLALFVGFFLYHLFTLEKPTWGQKGKHAFLTAVEMTWALILMAIAPMVAAWVLYAIFGASGPEPGETDW